MDASLIMKLVNSLDYPYPGASFYHNNKEYKLNEAKQAGYDSAFIVSFEDGNRLNWKKL